MADEKISDEDEATILVAGSPIFLSLKCAADYPKPGHLVSQLSETTAGLPNITDQATYGVAGVCLEDPTLDVNTAFAVNKPLRIVRLGSPCIVRSWMGKDAEGTTYIGMPAFTSQSTSGCWGVMGGSGSECSYITHEFSVASSAFRCLVGRVGRYDAQVTANLTIGHLQLSV